MCLLKYWNKTDILNLSFLRSRQDSIRRLSLQQTIHQRWCIVYALLLSLCHKEHALSKLISIESTFFNAATNDFWEALLSLSMDAWRKKSVQGVYYSNKKCKGTTGKQKKRKGKKREKKKRKVRKKKKKYTTRKEKNTRKKQQKDNIYKKIG